MSIRRKPAFINDSEFSFLQAGCIVCLAHHDTTTSSQSCDASIPNEALGSPVIILSIQESGRRLKSQVVFAPIISFQDSPSGDSTNPHLDPDDFVEIAKGIEEEDDPAVDFLIRIKAHFQQLSEDKIPRRVLHLRAGHEMAGSSHVRTKVYRTTASMLCKYAEKMPPPRLTPNALRYLRMKIAEKMEPVGEGDGSSISLKIWTGSKRLLEVGGVVAEGSRSRAQAFAMLKRKQKVLKGCGCCSRPSTSRPGGSFMDSKCRLSQDDIFVTLREEGVGSKCMQREISHHSFKAKSSGWPGGGAAF